MFDSYLKAIQKLSEDNLEVIWKSFGNYLQGLFVKCLTKFADDLTSVWSFVENGEHSVNSENAFAT